MYRVHIRTMRRLQEYFAPLFCAMSVYIARMHAGSNPHPLYTRANSELPGIIAATVRICCLILYDVAYIMVLQS